MTFYFYDLETSGFSASHDRIMQFAGQRTDLDLKPIGKPDNFLIKMTPDILPEPGAVLVHGISPQKTVTNGISEAEFAKYLTSRVSTPNTIVVGYNNIRFDNTFIRFLLWRNFHDAYEWSWKDGCSSWDLLDVGRMMRALRPEGINWPFAPNGKPSNSLELLSAINKLEHVDAHDAMSDVKASIAVARLLKNKQPKMFNYLLNIRQKSKVAPLVTKGDPLIYTSGRYSSDFAKTAVVVIVASKDDKSGALVYDLRIDPDEFKNQTVAELTALWKARDENAPYFPVKLLSYNKCPAIAPFSVLDGPSAKRLGIHKKIIDSHLAKLRKAEGFGDKLLQALDGVWPRRQPKIVIDDQDVDESLYDEFIKNEDRIKMSVVRAADPSKLSELNLRFKDERLNKLAPLYKARNFPEYLTADEQKNWNKFRHQKLLQGGNESLRSRFRAQVEELSKTPGLGSEKMSLLEDLLDWEGAITQII